MAIRWKHDDCTTMYFCTFTCFKWLPLIEMVDGYDLVYNWFDVLKINNYQTVAYVIMPNHLHSIFYFENAGFNLNKIISNGKRFLAYEMVRRLECTGQDAILQILNNGLSKRERRKGQIHKVFTDSFDAKGIYNQKFFNQKLNYIHLNPVRGKWNLVNDYRDYEHSSASFYELGKVKRYPPFDYRNI